MKVLYRLYVFMESTEDAVLEMFITLAELKDDKKKTSLEAIKDFDTVEQAEQYIEERIAEGCKEEFTIRKIYKLKE